MTFWSFDFIYWPSHERSSDHVCRYELGHALYSTHGTQFVIRFQYAFMKELRVSKAMMQWRCAHDLASNFPSLFLPYLCFVAPYQGNFTWKANLTFYKPQFWLLGFLWILAISVNVIFDKYRERSLGGPAWIIPIKIIFDTMPSVQRVYSVAYSHISSILKFKIPGLTDHSKCWDRQCNGQQILKHTCMWVKNKPINQDNKNNTRNYQD